MGQCIEKKIVQTKEWIDPSVTPEPIPEFDYNMIYPKTVYDAIKKTMDEDATTLSEDIASIYRMIGQRQTQLSGTPGNLIAYGKREGLTSEIEIIQDIHISPIDRASNKIPSEKAVGKFIDEILSSGNVNKHMIDDKIHLSEDDRSKLESAITDEDFKKHTDDTNIHVTAEDKKRWDSTIDGASFTNHTSNMNNPHHVNAHQVGTYTRREIDEIIASLRESYFNHKNINYDNRIGTAVLEEYKDSNWNPNYILGFGDSFPEVIDDTLTYFALRPATDYSANETQDCMIFIKRPSDDTWVQIGSQLMDQGDMVLQYPDTNMYAWLGGRFVPMFNMEGTSTGGSGTSDLMWRPMISENPETGLYQLGWTRSSETYAPAEVVISGPPGYTPKKGIDYDDGAPGIGIPTGGNIGDVLVKSTNDDYETEWKSVTEIGGGGTASSVAWKNVIGRPEIFNSRGYSEDGVMTQKSVTSVFDQIESSIVNLSKSTNNDLINIQKNIDNHINDTENPHRLTPEIIGATSNSQFLLHIKNLNNPHNINKSHIGLSNVDNTADMDKPVSKLMQLALDEINNNIKGLNDTLNEGNMVSNVLWNDQTCTLSFVFRNSSTPILDVEIPIIKIFSSITYDKSKYALIMTLPNGDIHSVSLRDLIYDGFTSDTIKVSIVGNKIQANIVDNSISGTHLSNDINLPGTPTVDTANVTDKSKAIANTEYVKSIVIDNLISSDTDRPLSANMGKYLYDTKADMAKVEKMIKDSPALTVIDDLSSDKTNFALSANMGRYLNDTKATKVHTDRSGSTYGKATAELFGHAKATNAIPSMNGTVSIGDDDGTYARGNHVHPTDTSRAPLKFGEDDILDGSPKAITPELGSNDNSIATTEWIHNTYPMMDYQDIVDTVQYAYKIIHPGGGQES